MLLFLTGEQSFSCPPRFTPKRVYVHTYQENCDENIPDKIDYLN
jgi:hypothetical protein